MSIQFDACGGPGGPQTGPLAFCGYRNDRDGRREQMAARHSDFCKPFTRVAVRYFNHACIAEAQKWWPKHGHKEKRYGKN